MQKAPDWKGTGLVPIKPVTAKNESGEEKIHVFGKNLEERVKTEDDNKDNTSAPLLFQFGTSQDASESSKKIQDEDIETIKKRKFEAITGEEDETTVFQGDFKIFCWDLKTSNWIERGRGQLKLNDSTQDDTRKSRLIMRLGGTYRIILNVSINHPHFKVITNSKTNIRFTDGQNLWAASGQNAQVLKELVEKRIDIPKKTQDTQPQTKTLEIPVSDPDTKKAKVILEDEANDDVVHNQDKNETGQTTDINEQNDEVDDRVHGEKRETGANENVQDPKVSDEHSETKPTGDKIVDDEGSSKNHVEVIQAKSDDEPEKLDSDGLELNDQSHQIGNNKTTTDTKANRVTSSGEEDADENAS